MPHCEQIWNSAVRVPNAYLEMSEGSLTATFKAPRGLDVHTPPCLTQNEHPQARARISVGSGSQVREKEMFPQWHLPWISTPATSGKHDQRQRNSTGKRLHPENLQVRGEGAEHAGDDDASQKENLDWVSVHAQGEAPYQSGSEETVVQALIRGQGFRCGREFRRQAEGPQAARLVPEEHLEDEKIDVQEGDHGNGDVRDGRHLV